MGLEKERGRAGRSAGAYQTHPANVSVWPPALKPATPGPGQDLRHHARPVRERVDSGSAHWRGLFPKNLLAALALNGIIYAL